MDLFITVHQVLDCGRLIIPTVVNVHHIMYFLHSDDGEGYKTEILLRGDSLLVSESVEEIQEKIRVLKVN